MHGVKRKEENSTLTSTEESLQLRAQELERLEAYQGLCDQFTTLYNFSNELKDLHWVEMVLECTRAILLKNPEYYTAWNERKRAVLLKYSSTDKEFIVSELLFNVGTIKSNPKSYSAWQHRRWILITYGGEFKEMIVSMELELLAQLLDLDSRNFHGWNYRIWLHDWANLNIGDEFDFTTLKIYQNFSNYSAWQRRSHLLPIFLTEHVISSSGDTTTTTNTNNEQKIIEFFRNEVELCRNAAWTEPSDQSVWFYQRWLFTFLSTCPLITQDFTSILVDEQLKSILELIREESYQSSIALAASFVIFMITNVKKVRTEEDGKIVREFRELLMKIDPLRKDHWKEI